MSRPPAAPRPSEAPRPSVWPEPRDHGDKEDRYAEPAEHQSGRGHTVARFAGLADLAARPGPGGYRRDSEWEHDELHDAEDQRRPGQGVGMGRRGSCRAAREYVGILPGSHGNPGDRQVTGDRAEIRVRAGGKDLAGPRVVLVLGQPSLGERRLQHADHALPVRVGRTVMAARRPPGAVPLTVPEAVPAVPGAVPGRHAAALPGAPAVIRHR